MSINARLDVWISLTLRYQETLVADAWKHRALHDGTAFVILDVSHPDLPVKRDFLGEALFLEVSDSIIVGIGQEMIHILVSFLNVQFEMVHKE